MPCLNKNNLQYLVAYNPSDPKLIIVDGSAAVNARFDEKFDYWYFQVSCDNSFKCFSVNDLIPKDILKKILNKEAFIVVDNGLEPFLRTADGIYQELVIKEQIPPEQIILMSSIPTMIDHVKALSKQYNQPEIKVEWWTMFEWSLKNYINFDSPVLPKTLVFKPYKRKFLNFNRRWRLHRPLLVTLLKDKNLLDLGYVSLGTSDIPGDNWDKKLKDLNYYYQNNNDILEILNRNQDIKSFSPMYLDTEDLVTNRADQTDSTNKYYENTYFSVITETTYHTNPGYDGVPFLSEKIFKSIAMKHPFILVTAPNTLIHLKKLGYKTFEGIIDESYDTELDDGKRMLKIVSAIEKLSNLTQEELRSFLIKSKEICTYNWIVLRDKKSFIYRMN